MTGPPAGLRRLHPLTPLARGWRVLAVGYAILAQGQLRSGDLPTLAGVTVLALVVGVGWGFLSWRCTWYAVEDEVLRIESGILVRRSRRVPLARLQAVDVVRPVLARLLGLAELRLEVAGGAAPEAPLAYLAEPVAQRLRAELLARAAGVGAGAPEAPEQVLVQVPPGVLAAGLALRYAPGLVLLAVLAVGALLAGGAPALLAAGAGLVPFALGTAGAAAAAFARDFGFTVAESPDGLRLRHGLLETRAQTVPPGRVQGVELVAPWLWRRPGWVRVEVTVAGYAGGRGEDRVGTLLPLAPRPVALAVVARVLPGVRVDDVPLAPVPSRARWRAPVAAGVLAAGTDAAALVTRRGRLVRRLSVVPQARVQSVRLVQGPWQRRLRLASVAADLSPGPVRAVAAHRDAGEARLLVETLAALARAARRTDRPQEWMRPPDASPTGPREPGG